MLSTLNSTTDKYEEVKKRQPVNKFFIPKQWIDKDGNGKIMSVNSILFTYSKITFVPLY